MQGSEVFIDFLVFDADDEVAFEVADVDAQAVGPGVTGFEAADNENKTLQELLVKQKQIQQQITAADNYFKR